MAGALTDLLGCKLPIQLAPMGSVSVTPQLPLAVAAAGGHAVVPAINLPPAHLARLLDALGARTRAFGVNLLVPVMHDGALEVAAERAPYVDFFLAEPDRALVAAARAGGAVCGWQVETTGEARAAEAAGCDVVIVKGAESGGRKRIEGPGLEDLLGAVLESVSIPVIAAGGIATADDVAAAFAAGAAGVRVGTRFIASAESDAHPAWIDAILAAEADDAVVSTAFNAGLPRPGPHRVLRASIAAAEALEDDAAGVVRIGGFEIEVPRFGPFPPTRESTGRVEAMPFYAGRSAGAVRAVQPAADIVADLGRGLPG